MKNTKKSLLLSALSLMMCVAMLIGTTYAWFTDSVTSGKNKIVAGNLDVELEYTTNGTDWTPVTETTKLFDDSALWEPGHTEVAYLRLSNAGTLALKYNLAINVANEVAGTNVAGESFKLSDYINMGVVEDWDGTVYADRDAARTAVTGAGKIVSYAKPGNMIAGAAETLAIVVYMPEEVGNEANYKTGTTAPSIELGVSLVATQDTVEADSFGIDYDENAVWPVDVGSAAELNVALAGNKPIQLTQDMDITDIDFTKDTKMNLGGHTITSNNANTIANGQDLTMKNGELKFTDDHSFTYIDVRPDDSTNGVYTFEGMRFTSEKKNATYGTCTDRIEKLVALTAEKNNAAKFIFKDCVFNNAKVLFSGMDDGGSFNATFENCTFTGLGSSEFIDASSYYVSGTITIKNCTFTMEATSSSAAAIEARNSVTVNFEGANTVNITSATAVSSENPKEVVKLFSNPVTSAKVVSGSNVTVNGIDTVTVSGIATK